MRELWVEWPESICVLENVFFLMIRRPPRSTQSRSSAASDVYKRQDLVVLASDGLWDVMSNQEAVDIALAHPDLGLACDALVSAAMDKGSNDNISALIVNTREYL
eukprot:TRINITY_DN11909_c0_g1_i1.p1 TRINITY_DN11909_c0_g1~~TRINITY_DN11909_c0_g1_i1.p1  ORF type:complete len:105 (+),score=37.29 TRINITY_DN11909_c0_g1_i1:63-377(+)